MLFGSFLRFSCHKKRRGFTLLEVMISVAITGLVVVGGFRLISMSLRSLSEVRAERDLTAAAQRVWLRFKTEKDMPGSGQEDYNPDKVERTRSSFSAFGISTSYKLGWRTEMGSVPVENLELTFRRVTVTLTDLNGLERSMVIYVPQKDTKDKAK